ncbi:MAG: class I SAM-dependent methyltransferase [Planctomycetes bacterium]|nr:class I SAM-dependent methyltransferase [Planctomycetota bacterium]
MSGHWVEELFIQRGEDYAKVLSSFLPRTRAEAEWIAELLARNEVPPGSRILDLACGIGRHAGELARLGYHVTGVDLSPAYIARAEELARSQGVRERVAYRVGDMREVGEILDGERFDAILNLFTSFGYYDDETNEVVLSGCRKIVRDGGLFLIDILNRDYLVQVFQPRGFTRVEDVLFLEDRDFRLETGRMRSTWTILKDQGGGSYQREAAIELDHRVYTLHELVGLFDQTGWAYREVHGSLTGEPFGVAARRIAALFAAC